MLMYTHTLHLMGTTNNIIFLEVILYAMKVSRQKFFAVFTFFAYLRNFCMKVQDGTGQIWI